MKWTLQNRTISMPRSSRPGQMFSRSRAVYTWRNRPESWLSMPRSSRPMHMFCRIRAAYTWRNRPENWRVFISVCEYMWKWLRLGSQYVNMINSSIFKHVRHHLFFERVRHASFLSVCFFSIMSDWEANMRTVYIFWACARPQGWKLVSELTKPTIGTFGP
jgi:hypothetical protein